jgi:hypothetical protein
MKLMIVALTVALAAAALAQELQYGMFILKFFGVFFSYNIPRSLKLVT